MNFIAENFISWKQNKFCFAEVELIILQYNKHDKNIQKLNLI